MFVVLTLRWEGRPLDGKVLERIRLIAESDKTHSEWGPLDGEIEVTMFDALKAVLADSRVSDDNKALSAYQFVIGGDFNDWEWIASQVWWERRETTNLLEKVSTSPTGRVAIITTDSRFGVSAAYTAADVVVAVNESFSFNGGPAHRKVTVCQARPGLVDLKAVFTELSKIEPGWGGSPTVGGSPQGESSVIRTDEIIKIVEEHLL